MTSLINHLRLITMLTSLITCQRFCVCRSETTVAYLLRERGLAIKERNANQVNRSGDYRPRLWSVEHFLISNRKHAFNWATFSGDLSARHRSQSPYRPDRRAAHRNHHIKCASGCIRINYKDIIVSVYHARFVNRRTLVINITIGKLSLV